MNIKYLINKWLESGLWWQFLFFTIINLVVFLICIGIYLCLKTSEYELGIWEALRLFLDSNSIIDEPKGYSWNNLLLLITETLGTILFSGLVVSIITNHIIQRVDSIKDGHIHYKFRNHIVIIGYDTIVPSIISELIKDPKYTKSKILLQASSPVDEIRSHLLTKLPKKALKQVVLVHAPRLSVEELELLYTASCKEIFIVGERNLDDHDAENIFTFETLVDIHERKGVKVCKPLTIWFENEATYAALQLNDINSKWREYFEFKPYNFYKRWANRLLTNSDYGTGSKKIVYPELDHDGIGKDSPRHVHLIIIGMNRMGIALAKEAAHMMHFPNFDESTGENRTRITFIDEKADIEKNFFIGRYPGYFDIAPTLYADMSSNQVLGFPRKEDTKKHFLDIQFEFIKGRIESDNVRNWIREQLKDDDAITTIAICLHNPSQSFGMAMYLPEEVYTRGREDKNNPWEVKDSYKIVNIFVRQEKTGSLIKSFRDTADSSDAKNKKYANIYPFGMVDDSFSINYYSNHLAMAFNYIYDFYFEYGKTLPASIPSPDELLKKWKLKPTSEKWSNLYLADSVEFKLRSMGYDETSIRNATLTDEDIERLAYTEHSRWNMEKLLMGYRPLSLEKQNKNFDTGKLKKTMFVHNLIKPYDDLKEEDKELDRNIIRKLPDILRMLNN
ncbi:MAG: hypothetical protein IKV23_04565 [Bacteroidaceae bacterium]|nr:hypothetical protein [Bacteroidaceae bacterium]